MFQPQLTTGDGLRRRLSNPHMLDVADLLDGARRQLVRQIHGSKRKTAASAVSSSSSCRFPHVFARLGIKKC